MERGTPDKVYGGHSLVNCPTTCGPKERGGLGILDPECFARVLRLQWFWFQWKHKERAWNGLDLRCHRRDRDPVHGVHGSRFMRWENSAILDIIVD